MWNILCGQVHRNTTKKTTQKDDQQTWQQARLDGIVDHHSLTEAAKELDAVAAAQHPKANHYYYSTFINLIYKELFNLKKGTTRGIRNRLNYHATAETANG